MKKLICAVAMLAAAGPAFAQGQPGQRTTDNPINPFSDCGIGAALFPDTAWAAVITNVTWDVGTTAVISAVSSPNTCNGGQAKTAMYITSTYASLEADTAVGEGKYLTGLADVMTCDANVRPQLFQRVRAEMKDVLAQPNFANQEKIKKAEAYFLVADQIAREEFSSSCYRS